MTERAYDQEPVTVAFRTLGCKVNRVESEDAAAALLGSGVVLSSEDDAAVIVVNTCTVTREADAKARKAVRQALKAARSPIVVVTGCLASLDVEGVRALGDRVVVEPDKEALAAVVAELLGIRLAEQAGVVRTGEGFRTRSMLKVQDGCDNYCTYCIVPYARGVPRSVEYERVMADATALLETGASELVLTGINLGRYRSGECGLGDLVVALKALGAWRVRISSIEPPDVDEALVSRLIDAGVRHLHMPLQSGSDAVLEAMDRRYDATEFARRAQAFLQAGGLSISTDVMVGFPGETDADFQATLDFVEHIGFSRLHVFRYSPRQGTPAAGLVQIPADIKAQRANELRRLGQHLMQRHLNTRVGATEELLIEQVDADGQASATTVDYAKAEFPSGGRSAGERVVCRFSEARDDRLIATLVPPAH